MNTVMIQDKMYPGLLKEIPDAPKKLYYKGDWNSEIFAYCLAVVGTRRMTSYGKRICEELVGEIAASGITIVSGFMYGVDATAHKATLRVGGKTIAVMPCGIDLIHPEDQEDLYNEILETGGLILSEFEGDFKPLLWTYPKRNRIVAGLCQATLVVEAGEKSGSLITANFTKKYERKLFAIPGPLTSEVAKGTAQLLKEGASIVTCAKDVVDFYRSDPGFSLRFTPPAGRGPTRLQKTQDLHSNSTLEQKILEYLKRESVGLDSLVRAFNVQASQIGAAISILQLEGFISEDQGKFYVN